MKYRKTLIDILSELVDSLDPEVTITAVVSVGDTHTLTVCDVKWAQPGFTLTIGGDPYTIESVDSDTQMVVSGAPAPVPGTFDLYQLYFFHGTPIETNAELKDIEDANSKTPMVYLLRNFREDVDRSADAGIEREAVVRLFFLTQADFTTITADLYENCIRPMSRLGQMIEQAILVDSKTFSTPDDFTFAITEHIRFGVYIANRGMEKSLFADNLSGVEMAGTLRIYRDLACGDPCTPTCP